MNEQLTIAQLFIFLRSMCTCPKLTETCQCLLAYLGIELCLYLCVCVRNYGGLARAHLFG